MEAEQIAEGLTKGQGRALPLFVPDVWHGPASPPGASAFKAALFKLGILERSWLEGAFWFRLTPLGLAVRAAIERKPHDH